MCVDLDVSSLSSRTVLYPGPLRNRIVRTTKNRVAVNYRKIQVLSFLPTNVNNFLFVMQKQSNKRNKIKLST